jgi:hypothetical protein
LGDDLEIVSTADFGQPLRSAIAGVEAVIHLAGEPVVGRRWSAAQKLRLRASRVDFTRLLVRLLSDLPVAPHTLISASAVGFYGSHAASALESRASAGEGFLAKLCEDWEREAFQMQSPNTRVVALRTGIVLAVDGGALPKLLPAFRMGLGGRIGSGQQVMPWIHIDDVVESILRTLHDTSLRGAINVVSPTPVSNREFAHSLAQVVGKPALLPVPAPLLRLAMGEAAAVLLGGQRALPSKLLASGFQFSYPTLHEALADLVQNDMGCTITSAGALPDSEYLRTRRPRYELRQQTLIHAPIAEVRDFFARPENLGLLTPPDVDFRITSAPLLEMKAGAVIRYRIKIGPFPVRWRTRIESHDPSGNFVDVQTRGPYRCWWHQHSFRAHGDKTWMEDRVLYAIPLGPLGRIVHRLKVSGMLRKIFSYRSRAIRFRFGSSALGDAPASPLLQVYSAKGTATAGR